MRAVGDKAVEAGFGFRYGVGSGDAGNIEAARAGLLGQRRFDFRRRS
jgi:hypothetical protein